MVLEVVPVVDIVLDKHPVVDVCQLVGPVGVVVPVVVPVVAPVVVLGVLVTVDVGVGGVVVVVVCLDIVVSGLGMFWYCYVVFASFHHQVVLEVCVAPLGPSLCHPEGPVVLIVV